MFSLFPSGWLEDYDSEVIDRISKRISSLTGLDTGYQAAEEMQVIWYFIVFGIKTSFVEEYCLTFFHTRPNLFAWMKFKLLRCLFLVK